MDSQIDKETADLLLNGVLNLHNRIISKKPHIKKYKKNKKLYEEILDSMEKYLFENKYDSFKYFNQMTDYILNIKPPFDMDIELYPNKQDDLSIILELFVFKNSPQIPSITEEYIKKHKFKNKEKLKMLESMNSSVVSLFQIESADSSEGYVIYKDVFTRKKYKIIDITLSFTFKENISPYVYTRLITYDDITFQTGINCPISNDNQNLKQFLKHHNYKKHPNFYRCLALYAISKKNNSQINFHTI